MIGANTGAVSAADASLGLAELSFIWPLDDVALGGMACPHATPVAASASFELPDGGGWVTSSLAPPTTGLRFQRITPCGSIAIQGFTAVQPPATSPLPEVALGVQIKAPGVVKAGTTLDYTVVINNVTGQPLDLGSLWPYCPGYAEFLNVPGQTVAKALYQLNCRPAPTLQPQGSISFQMKLPVPKVLSGAVELHWNLDSNFSSSAAAHTAIRVIQ